MSEEKELIHLRNQITFKIKTALMEQGMSQDDLAKELGINKAQLSQAINGYPNTASINIRKKIYEILGMHD